jgi:hypothetical protein
MVSSCIRFVFCIEFRYQHIPHSYSIILVLGVSSSFTISRQKMGVLVLTHTKFFVWGPFVGILLLDRKVMDGF